MPRVSFLLALLCLPLVIGCEGCRRDPNADSEEQEQAPLEDFTPGQPLAFPADLNAAGGGIKPGHWMGASQSLKSNKVDARGELLSEASASGSNFQTGVQEGVDGELPTRRPIVLPKGQMRRFDYRILSPSPGIGDQQRSYLSSRFVSSGRTTFFDTGRTPFAVLQSEEFFFVVLTERPERFAKFQVSDWVRPYRDELAFTKDQRANYRIVFPPTKDLLPISETMLDWTSTAVVFWDDLSPDALTPQQQTAMADWVRFGGQLIVNGAIASDAISKSALADLLPLQPTGNIELDPDSATELLKGWAVTTDPTTEKQIALLRSQAGRVAVDGRLAPGTQTLSNTGNLVLERRVGSGRVVQPRFDVTSDWFANWQSYDSFVNGVLLLRPPRRLSESEDAQTMTFIQQDYLLKSGVETKAADPAMNSRFRLTARDAILRTNEPTSKATTVSPSRVDPFTYINRSSGIGGWDDDSDAISLCRQLLRNESGIEIPKSTLVVKSLGYYLLILVPLNYLFFRLLGRLEYAWLAVPVIAIGGAVWVARAARLDIGFARSQTEIALLEVQPNYERAHLSRVVAIYNSLSSRYQIEFDSIDAAAMPIWGTGAGDNRGGSVFQMGFSSGPVLSDVAVGSNQVRMVHAEQMLPLGGTISLDEKGMLVNQTAYELFDSIVLRKSLEGDAELAVVGPCASGSAVSLRFRNVDEASLDENLPSEVNRLSRRLLLPAAIPPGSTRLVGQLQDSMPGMTITPDANQSSSQTILLAHLEHAPLPAARIDVNLIGDFRKALTDEDETDSDTSDEQEES